MIGGEIEATENDVYQPFGRVMIDDEPDPLRPVEFNACSKDLSNTRLSIQLAQAWFAGNAPFGNAAELLLHPDHYIFRMLYSQGIPLDALGIRNPDADPRESWRLFAGNYHLFRGPPSRMWMDWVLDRKSTRLNSSH